MTLEEARGLVGKTVEFKSAFGHRVKGKIEKVRQIPDTDTIVAEMNKGECICNIDILEVLD